MVGGPAEHGGYYDPTKYSDVPQYQQGFGPQEHELHSTPNPPYQQAAELNDQRQYQHGQHELP